MTTQREQVLAAMVDGPGTSGEVAADTGLPVKHCSAILRTLWRLKKVTRSDKTVRMNTRDRGAYLYTLKVYAPKVDA